MALVLEDFPGALVVGSLEPFRFRVKWNHSLLVSGDYEQFRITFVGNPAIGNSMNIALVSPAFSCAISFVDPTSPVTQPSTFPAAMNVPAKDAGDTLAFYIDTYFIPYLLTLQELEGFQIYRTSTNAVTLRSNTQAANRVSAVSATGFSITTAHIINGAATSIPDNAFVKIQLIMTEEQHTGNFSVKSPWHHYRPVLDNGSVVVEANIEDLLDAMMREIDVLSPASFGSTVVRGARRFRIRYAEEFINSDEQVYSYITDQLTLVKGGRRTGDFDNPLDKVYETTFITLRKQPWVDRRLNDWLYFVEPDIDSGTVMRMRATVKGVWGTSAGNNFTTITPKGKASIHMVPCGYDQLNLQALLGDEEPYYYDIEIYKQVDGVITDVIIEAFRFYVNPESDTRMGLHYYNFAGLMEAQALDAPVQMVNAWQQDSVMLAYPEESNHTGSGLEVHKERGVNKWHQLQCDVNTGPLSGYNWMAAQDILNSERVWLVNLNEGVNRMAATVVKGSEKMTPYSVDGVNFHSLGFSIKLNKEKGNSVPERLIS